MPEELVAQVVDEQVVRHWSLTSRWMVLVIVLGLYLTLRGYHSRDGDQAYRLPLLLHQQTPSVYQDDPFVRAFDQFNPHRGALMLLDVASRPLGLSAGLFALFVLTFGLTYLGVDRLAREVWPIAGNSVGTLAFILLLTAKAGNIGTNHLFESMLLDRLQAFALGWVAIAGAVGAGRASRPWGAPLALGLATLIHPSAGLQLALIVAGSWLVWAIAGRWTGVEWNQAIRAILLIALSVIPGLFLNTGKPDVLLDGLAPDDYWTLAVELQSPQHMLPHLWRMPQWLGWSCYLVLMAIALLETRRTNPISDRFKVTADDPAVGRIRLVLMLGTILAGLALAWIGIEVLHDVRITVFQPFRMATIARGIALVFFSGHVLELWRKHELVATIRATLLVVGLIGDWLLIVVTALEITAASIGFVRRIFPLRIGFVRGWSLIQVGLLVLVLGLGLRFLSRHDTESGHLPLLIALAVAVLLASPRIRRRLEQLGSNWVRSRKMTSILAGAAWVVPALAMLAGLVPANYPLDRRPEIHALVSRCRFFESPDDEVERLAVWCRENTPDNARFIGPPGPKTFRLWSRRALAFNRASSPYHAAGLADWFSRFRDHVGFHGSAEEFVQEYLRNRHGIESRYEGLNCAERTQLAFRQGATHVITASPSEQNANSKDDSLELLHAEGRYAVYRVRSEALVTLKGSDKRPR